MASGAKANECRYAVPVDARYVPPLSRELNVSVGERNVRHKGGIKVERHQQRTPGPETQPRLTQRVIGAGPGIMAGGAPVDGLTEGFLQRPTVTYSDYTVSSINFLLAPPPPPPLLLPLLSFRRVFPLVSLFSRPFSLLVKFNRSLDQETIHRVCVVVCLNELTGLLVEERG